MKAKARIEKRKRDASTGGKTKSAAPPRNEIGNHPKVQKIEPNLTKGFLTSGDGEAFENLLRNHYQGFVHVPVDKLVPSNFYAQAKQAFERLRDANYYHVRDIISPFAAETDWLTL
eukprot:scaffold22577_cov122-Cylindrotheca_fusiformis.AAC.23